MEVNFSFVSRDFLCVYSKIYLVAGCCILEISNFEKKIIYRASKTISAITASANHVCFCDSSLKIHVLGADEFTLNQIDSMDMEIMKLLISDNLLCSINFPSLTLILWNLQERRELCKLNIYDETSPPKHLSFMPDKEIKLLSISDSGRIDVLCATEALHGYKFNCIQVTPEQEEFKESEKCISSSPVGVAYTSNATLVLFQDGNLVSVSQNSCIQVGLFEEQCVGICCLKTPIIPDYFLQKTTASVAVEQKTVELKKKNSMKRRSSVISATKPIRIETDYLLVFCGSGLMYLVPFSSKCETATVYSCFYRFKNIFSQDSIYFSCNEGLVEFSSGKLISKSLVICGNKNFAAFNDEKIIIESNQSLKLINLYNDEVQEFNHKATCPLIKIIFIPATYCIAVFENLIQLINWENSSLVHVMQLESISFVTMDLTHRKLFVCCKNSCFILNIASFTITKLEVDECPIDATWGLSDGNVVLFLLMESMKSQITKLIITEDQISNSCIVLPKPVSRILATCLQSKDCIEIAAISTEGILLFLQIFPESVTIAFDAEICRKNCDAKDFLLVLHKGNVIVSSNDGVICCFDAAKKEETDRIQGHDSPSNGTAKFSLTKNLLFSYGHDEVLHIWKTRGEAEADVEPIVVSIPVVEKEEIVSNEESEILIRKKLHDLKQKLDSLVQLNNEVPENEKLSQNEMLINIHHAEELQKESEARINEVRKELETQKKASLAEIEEIRERCWNTMQVQGKAIHSHSGEFWVSNYPIRIPIPEKEAEEERLLEIRRSQLNQEDIDVDKFVYPTQELNTVESKQIQIAIHCRQITKLKSDFNLKFEEMIRVNAEEIGKINDRFSRIKAVLKELGLPFEHIKTMDSSNDEIPEKIWEVSDKEITVPKCLSEEEEAKIARKKALEEERQRLKQDNSHARGLKIMMGGKLIDEERQTQVVILKPDFIDQKPKTEWTEDEKKLAKDYEKKLAVQMEEQEKYKKSLETELRKLESSVDELKAQFDAKLSKFQDDKNETDSKIYQLELRCFLLARRIYHYRICCQKFQDIESRIENMKTLKNSSVHDGPELKAMVEAQKEVHDQLIKKDKEIEKQFKKDFSRCGVPMEVIQKLFKYRTTETFTPIPESEMPPMMAAHSWSALNSLRQKKMALELEIKQSAQKLDKLRSLYQNALNYSDGLKKESANLKKIHSELEQSMLICANTVDDLWTLKQGQVEIQQSPVSTDYSGAALIHRNEVEAVNKQIIELAKHKVDALKEMKNYRRGILSLEWEIKLLNFKMEDVVLRTRDIHLMRVTKAMQEYIQSGDDSKSQNQAVTMEKLLEHSQKAFQQKEHEKKSQIVKIEREIQKWTFMNKELTSENEKLEQETQQREKIQLHRYQDTNSTKIYAKLNNLFSKVKSQAQIISQLKLEVEKWKSKTIVSFPKLPTLNYARK